MNKYKQYNVCMVKREINPLIPTKMKIEKFFKIQTKKITLEQGNGQTKNASN